MDGEISSLMDSSERYKEASKTFQLDEEWNLRFDDGQAELWGDHFAKEAEQRFRTSRKEDRSLEELIKMLKAKYGEDCDLTDAYADYLANHKGESNEDATEA